MIDGLNDISGCDPPTLIKLAERVERSTDAEHFVYRESEVDEVWRLAESELDAVSGSARDPFARRLSLIHEAHDLLGDEDSIRAASLLRAAAAIA